MARTRGYHYARRADGTKYRVYSGRGRTGRRTKGVARRRRGGRRVVGRPVYSGYGAYRKGGGYGRPGMGFGRVMRGRSSGLMENTVPVIKNSKGGVVIVQHTEFLGDVQSSQAFSNNAYILNPGLALEDGGFTEWLHNVAENFEEFRARGICFHYKSTSAEYSNVTGSALGTVSLATNYNVLNNAFVSKIAMENYEGSTSVKPSKNVNHFVECQNKQTPLHPMYIRTSPTIPTNADQRMYDLGMFQIATSGMNSSGVTVGELWVSYEIEFFKPRLNPDVQTEYDHFQFPAAAGILPATPFGTDTTGLKFPTTQSQLGGAVSGGIVAAAACVDSPTTAAKANFEGGVPTNGGTGQALGPTAANTYYFPPQATIGSVFMICYQTGLYTAGVPGAWTITPRQCTATNLLNANVNSAVTNTGAGNATDLVLIAFVTITAAYANITFTNAGAQANNGGAQQGDLFVTLLGQPVN